MDPTSGLSAERGTSAHSDTSVDPFTLWVEKYGADEYALYKKSSPAATLTYEGWVNSPHALGPYLYHLTLDIWNEESSDEEVQQANGSAATPAHLGPGQVEKATVNGSNTPNGVHFPPSAPGGIGAPASSSKKRHKKKRKNGVTPDTSSKKDNESSPVPPAGPKGADTSVSTTKKRKQKKESLSMQSATPEALPEPTQATDGPTLTARAESPDKAGPSPATRKGLRTRTPAQQRPYYHHAKLFEEVVEAVGEDESADKQSPMSKSKLVHGNHANSDDDSKWQEEHVDHDSLAQQQSEPPKQPKKRGRPRKSQPAVMSPNQSKSPAATAGLKATKAAALAPQTAPRPRGRPRKTNLSEEFVRDDSDSDEAQEALEKEKEIEASQDVVMVDAAPSSEKRKRKARKAYLSQEFVEEDSDSAQEQNGEPTVPILKLRLNMPTQKPSKPRYRKPRKSHLSEEFVRDDTDSEIDPEAPILFDVDNVTPVKQPVSNGQQRKASVVSEVESDGEQTASPPKSARRAKERNPTNSGNTKKTESSTMDLLDEDEAQMLSTPLRKGRRRRGGSLASVASPAH